MKFLGLMRVKNEARFIRASLASQHFCEKVIVLDQRSDDGTPWLAREFPNVRVIDSHFEDCNEGRDREWLAEIAHSLHPEWLVTLDGDEALEADAWQKIQRVADDPGVRVIDVHSLHLWNNRQTLRVDGHFGAGYRQRIWRLPQGKLTYRPKDCALPEQLDRVALTRIGLALWHFGSIDVAKRRRRFESCISLDPNGVDGGNYRVMIQGDPGGPDPSDSLAGGGPMRLQSVDEFLDKDGAGYSRWPSV